MLRPEEARVLTERNIFPARGPKFFRDEDGAVQFEFVIDSTNIVGPKPATEKDQAEHPEAWARFVKGDATEPAPADAAPVSLPKPRRAKRKG